MAPLLPGAGGRLGAGPTARVLVAARRPQHRTVEPRLLQQLYGLKPSEARLAAALLDGQTLKSYAARARAQRPDGAQLSEGRVRGDRHAPPERARAAAGAGAAQAFGLIPAYLRSDRSRGRQKPRSSPVCRRARPRRRDRAETEPGRRWGTWPQPFAQLGVARGCQPHRQPVHARIVTDHQQPARRRRRARGRPRSSARVRQGRAARRSGPAAPARAPAPASCQVWTARRAVEHSTRSGTRPARAAARPCGSPPLAPARRQIAVVVADPRLVPARLGVAQEKQLDHLDGGAPGMG